MWTVYFNSLPPASLNDTIRTRTVRVCSFCTKRTGEIATVQRSPISLFSKLSIHLFYFIYGRIRIRIVCSHRTCTFVHTNMHSDTQTSSLGDIDTVVCVYEISFTSSAYTAYYKCVYLQMRRIKWDDNWAHWTKRDRTNAEIVHRFMNYGIDNSNHLWNGMPHTTRESSTEIACAEQPKRIQRIETDTYKRVQTESVCEREIEKRIYALET